MSELTQDVNDTNGEKNKNSEAAMDSSASNGSATPKDSQTTQHDAKLVTGSPNDTQRKPNSTHNLDELPPLQETCFTEQLDSFQELAKRDIALHLKSLNILVTSESLDEIFQLFEMHLNSLMGSLQKIASIQRRKKASPRDLDLLLRNCQLGTGELEEEFEKTKKLLNDHLIKQKVAIEKTSEKLLNRSALEEQVEININDPSYIFFVQDKEIYNLVPSTYTNKHQKAIPAFLPEFPPDHTYRKSPIYLNQIPDQKTMRAKLVQESRFVGEAIDKLVINNKVELQEQAEFEKQRLSQIESSKSKLTEKIAENLGYDIWNFTEKKLDIPAYAKARLEYLRRKEEREENIRTEEESNYDRMVSNLSPYAKVDDKGRTYEEVPDTTALLSKLHKEALLSVKILKKKKIEREEKRQELLKKAEIERKEKIKEQKRLAKEARVKAAAEAAAAAQNSSSAAATGENGTSVDDFENFGNTDFDNFESFDNSNTGELVFDFGDDQAVDLFAEDNGKDNKQTATTEETNKDTETVDGDVKMKDAYNENPIKDENIISNTTGDNSKETHGTNQKDEMNEENDED